MSREGYSDSFVKQTRSPAKKKQFSNKDRSYGYDHDVTTGKESAYKRKDKYKPVMNYNVDDEGWED